MFRAARFALLPMVALLALAACGDSIPAGHLEGGLLRVDDVGPDWTQEWGTLTDGVSSRARFLDVCGARGIAGVSLFDVEGDTRFSHSVHALRTGIVSHCVETAANRARGRGLVDDPLPVRPCSLDVTVLRRESNRRDFWIFITRPDEGFVTLLRIVAAEDDLAATLARIACERLEQL
jgi:hypothetical protein